MPYCVLLGINFLTAAGIKYNPKDEGSGADTQPKGRGVFSVGTALVGSEQDEPTLPQYFSQE